MLEHLANHHWMEPYALRYDNLHVGEDGIAAGSDGLVIHVDILPNCLQCDSHFSTAYPNSLAFLTQPFSMFASARKNKDPTGGACYLF